MKSELVKVYSSRNIIDAGMVKAMLYDNGIEVMELNKIDSSYQNFGEFELYCPQSQILEALHLINNK